MPCRDGRELTNIVDNPETIERLDKATRILCSLITYLENGQSTILYEYSQNNSELREWWNNHLKEDRLKRQAYNEELKQFKNKYGL